MELFRLGYLTVPPFTTLSVFYDALWATATWGMEERKAVFEMEFQIIHVTVEDVGFSTSLNLGWYVPYNVAVMAGDVSLTSDCETVSL